MQKEVDYVKASQYRIKIMKSLDGKVKIPSEIAKEIGMPQKRISGSIDHLKNHNLIECINPQVRKGRLYRLTYLGKEVVKKL